MSGSGKSTLVNDILYRALMQKIYRSKTVPGRHRTIEGAEHLDKVIDIDQSPIGRSPRSNPATYTGVFDKIRNLFAQTQEAKVRGYQPGRFSFNVKGGRCEACAGDGTIKIEMHFLPDVYVPCEVCKGARYNRDTLDVTFKGKNIAEVLDLTVEEACEFFANQPVISRHLVTLKDVGLGYIRLGQPATTLSGGEAQRVKLASELAKRATGRTIYILDEPTTGLHFEDVRHLIGVLQRLVDTGNTVLVIEHNLDVIKTADWIVDLGPEGGDGGGRVVAEGTPEVVAKVPGELHREVPGRGAQARGPGSGAGASPLGGTEGSPVVRRQHDGSPPGGVLGSEPGAASQSDGRRRRNRASPSGGASSAGTGTTAAENRTSLEPGGTENWRRSGVRAHGSGTDSVAPAGSVMVTCPDPPLSTVAVKTTGRAAVPGLCTTDRGVGPRCRQPKALTVGLALLEAGTALPEHGSERHLGQRLDGRLCLPLAERLAVGGQIEEREPTVGAHGRRTRQTAQLGLQPGRPIGIAEAIDGEAGEPDRGNAVEDQLGRLPGQCILPIRLPALHPAVAPAKPTGMEVAHEMVIVLHPGEPATLREGHDGKLEDHRTGRQAALDRCDEGAVAGVLGGVRAVRGHIGAARLVEQGDDEDTRQHSRSPARRRRSRQRSTR